MGCNPSKDGAVSADVGGGVTNKAGDKLLSSSSTAKNNVAETILIPLSDDFEERDSSLTGSIGEEEKENSKTMKTSEEAADFEKEFRSSNEELCHAATKIQASFRGHRTRKQQAGGKDEPGGATTSKVDNLESKLKNVDINKDADLEEFLDLNLKDPDLHKAATKIQASFREHKARKVDDACDKKQ